MGRLVGRRGLFLAVMLGCLAIAPPASAGLIGDTVTVNYLFPDQSTLVEALGTQTVAPTALFNAFDQLDFKVTNNTLQITDVFPGNVLFTAAAFNGIHLIDESRDDITGVTLDPASNLTGFGADDITFDGSDIWVSIEDTIVHPNTYVQLDISVPEPVTLSLFGAGLAGAVVMCRHQKRKA